MAIFPFFLMGVSWEFDNKVGFFFSFQIDSGLDCALENSINFHIVME